MIYSKLLKFIFIFLFLTFYYMNAIEKEWILKDIKNKVSVYTKDINKNKPKTFKGTLKIKSTMDSLISVLYDLDNYNTWLEDCKSSSLHKSISFKENYIYQVSHISFPFRNRDAIYHTILSQEGKDFIISFETNHQMYLDNINSSDVQIIFSKGKYKFFQINKKEVLVSFEIFVDLGENIPLYFTNLTLEEIVIKSLINLSTMSKKKPYVTHKLYFNKDKEIIGIKL